MEKTLKKYFLIFTLPTVIAFAFAFLIPFVQGVYLSFCKFTTVSNATWVGFKNYKDAFSGIFYRSERYNNQFAGIFDCIVIDKEN